MTAMGSRRAELVFAQGKVGDPRMGSLVVPMNEKPADKIAAGLIWFPFDQGTLLNGGRGGSRDSPSAVAQMLAKLGTTPNPEEGVDLGKHLCLVDVGEATGETLEATHASLEQLTLWALSAGVVPIVVGGSNDQSYSNASAWLTHSQAARRGTVVNIDAHFDVRPLTTDGKRHSGAPFYCLLEDSRFEGRLVEFAAQGHQCSQEHANYINESRGAIHWMGALRKLPLGPVEGFRVLLDSTPGPIFISFDVDSISARDMPGVSCPSAVGLTAEEAVEIARLAGCNAKVDMLDLSELNVAIEGDRSPRLVALIIYSFLLGLAEREGIAGAALQPSHAKKFKLA